MHIGIPSLVIIVVYIISPTLGELFSCYDFKNLLYFMLPFFFDYFIFEGNYIIVWNMSKLFQIISHK